MSDRQILRRVRPNPGQGNATFLFFCPGCRCAHGVWVEEPNAHTGAQWTWNGSMERPTFQPSILIEYSPAPPDRPERCHLYVTDGRIQYLPDCTHALAGQTIPLPPF
ncbi:MAG: DUF6527 family protein [Verrucomicrobiota bacterium]